MVQRPKMRSLTTVWGRRCRRSGPPLMGVWRRVGTIVERIGMRGAMPSTVLAVRPASTLTFVAVCGRQKISADTASLPRGKGRYIMRCYPIG